MPLLRKAKSQRVTLPSTKDLPENQQAWVELKDTMLTGEMVGVTQGENYKEHVLYGLVETIIDWNLEDLVVNDKGEEEHVKAPINIAMVARLEAEDFVFLTGELERIKGEQNTLENVVDTEQKKTSSPTLKQPESPETPSVPQI